MKTERKVYVFVLVGFLICAGILNAIGTRIITPTSDDQATKIICSNGNEYSATYANIQTAADSITGSGWIRLGQATYTVTGTTTIQNKNIEIQGQGAAIIDLSSYNGVAFRFQSTGARSYYSCGIVGVNIIGDDTDTSSVFVNFTSVIGHIKDCVTINGDRIYRFATIYYGCNGTRITNNKITCLNGIDSNGVSYEPYGVIVSDNQFDGRYVSGSDPLTCCGIDFSYGRGCQITSNQIKDYVYGVNATGCYGVDISSNYINGKDNIYSSSQFATINGNFLMCDYLSSTAIHIYGTLYGGSISGNTMWSYQNNNFKGIYFESTCRRWSVTGNTIIQEQTPTGTYGIYGSGTCTNFTIVGNALNNLNALTGTGISFSSLSGSTIVGNAITNWSTETSISGTGNQQAYNS